MVDEKPRVTDVVLEDTVEKVGLDNGLNQQIQNWEEEKRKSAVAVGKPTKTADESGVLDFSVGDPLARAEKLKDGAAQPGSGGGSEQPIQAKLHKVVSGDTLNRLAERQLGANATRENVQKYVKEIQDSNELKDTKIVKGKMLSLPGRNGDGSTVIMRDSVTSTTWPDGRAQYDYKDGRKLTRTAEIGGSYSQQSSGPRPEDNFYLRKTPDGKYLISDKAGMRPVETNEQNDVRAAHAKMHDLAEAKIKDPSQRAKFEADMARFEGRARERGLPDAEVTKTYGEVIRMMEAGSGAVNAERRIQLAQQVLSQAADPRIIDQGDKNTCNVTAVETMIYTTDPSKAAGLVSQVALSGEYSDPDGNKVKLDKHSLTPDEQARRHPTIDGERSFATQLFNVTAVNLAYQRDGVQRRYEQHARSSEPNDSGERLYDTSKQPRVELKEEREPDLDDDQIVEAHRGITGRQDEVVFLSSESNIAGLGTKLTKVADENAFNSRLAKLAADGKLPVIIGIQSNVEPFYTDVGGMEASDSGPHVVTVTGYRPGNPPHVSVDNTWGSSTDKRTFQMSTSDLWVAMKGADVDTVRKEVQDNRAKGKIDFQRELDLLRFERSDDVIDDAAYGKAVADKMMEARSFFKQQEKDKRLDKTSQDRFEEKYNYVIENMNPSENLAMMAERHRRKDLTDKELVSELGAKIQDARDDYLEKRRRGTLTSEHKERHANLNEAFETYLKSLPRPLRDALRRSASLR